LKVDGAAGNWSYLYWRKHILALAKHVRRAKDKLRTRKPVLPQPEAVAERVEMQMAELLANPQVGDSDFKAHRHSAEAGRRGARFEVRGSAPDRARRKTDGPGKKASVPNTERLQGNQCIEADSRLDWGDRSRCAIAARQGRQDAILRTAPGGVDGTYFRRAV
jgi:hypothetical protein